jgi:hypothetical protein
MRLRASKVYTNSALNPDILSLSSWDPFGSNKKNSNKPVTGNTTYQFKLCKFTIGRKKIIGGICGDLPVLCASQKSKNGVAYKE